MTFVGPDQDTVLVKHLSILLLKESNMCGLCYDKGKYIVQKDEMYEIVDCECQIKGDRNGN